MDHAVELDGNAVVEIADELQSLLGSEELIELDAERLLALAKPRGDLAARCRVALLDLVDDFGDPGNQAFAADAHDLDGSLAPS